MYQIDEVANILVGGRWQICTNVQPGLIEGMPGRSLGRLAELLAIQFNANLRRTFNILIDLSRVSIPGIRLP